MTLVFEPKRTGMAGRLRRRLLGIHPRETSAAHRGFRVAEHGLTEHLEQVGRTFVAGYHAAAQFPDFTDLEDALNRIDAPHRGFAYEGAGMALALLDCLTPWRAGRLERFLHGFGADHAYMIHVGVGWAWARWPGSPERRLESLDPLLRWLALDGTGFHAGYFHWPTSIARQERPALSPYGERAFDQGLGRSLWFVESAHPDRIAAAVDAFPEARRADLWSGVGLAAAYAGGVSTVELRRLRDLAAEYLPEAAQGVSFAAKARKRAGNPVPHTEAACVVFCQGSLEEAARATDEALARAVPEPGVPLYEAWRRNLRITFGRRERAS